MRLLMLGAPGSGKGTQAERLAAHYGVAHLATGEMLRREIAAGTDLGREVEATLAAGDLVPDDLIEDLVYGPFVEASRAGGFVLDGFPRTLHQAERAFGFAQELGATLHAVVHLDVPSEELLRRALERDQGRGRPDRSSTTTASSAGSCSTSMPPARPMTSSRSSSSRSTTSNTKAR
jgi:adenylate kinase